MFGEIEMPFHRWVTLSFLLASSAFVVAQEKTPTPAKRPEAMGSTKKTEPTPARRPNEKTADALSEAKADSHAGTLASPSPAPKTRVATVSNAKASTVNSPSGERYLLRYNLKPNTKIISQVTHLAKTTTKINDVEQASQSRTVSRKVWTITNVARNGDMTFVHHVESVDMSQQVGDGEELKYNSTNDKKPLEVFKKVAESIGQPIATVTISATGQVVHRTEEALGANLGMGDITIPMPDEAIVIGDQWETSREIRVRRTDGTPKTIKVRELYTLDKVNAGVATIGVRSEPLTPLTEPEIEAQALQQMNNGTIKFDLDSGRLISKGLAWDKTVVGFSGPGSLMDYSARFDEVVEK
jgi:hypothetical protein